MRACPVCHVEFPQPTGAAQFKVYCSRKCKGTASARQHGRGRQVIPERPCVVCGKVFAPIGWTKYCSPNCRATASRRGRGVKPKGIAPVRSCSTCGRLTTRGNFCSVKCRTEFERPCDECGEMFAPRGAQQYCSIPCRRRHNNNLARDLGKPWMKTYKDTPQRRAHWERRQALIRGATAPGELVSRREVFERDGWICGLCDTPVDPTLRYPDPMSVSIDHVVPVSLHGDHSMANVQCAHLSCNLSKNNRVA